MSTNFTDMPFNHYEDGLRIIKTEGVDYHIKLDRSTSLWMIEASAGPTPVALRDRWTSAYHANLAIQAYIQDFPNRQIAYKQKPKAA